MARGNISGKGDLVRGTLDMLVLKTLSLQPLHGLGLSRRIDQISGGVFTVKPGSLFPAWERALEVHVPEGTWGESENNRRAKFYELTPDGRHRLGEERANWAQAVRAITKVLEAT